MVILKTFYATQYVVQQFLCADSENTISKSKTSKIKKLNHFLIQLILHQNQFQKLLWLLFSISMDKFKMEVFDIACSLNSVYVFFIIMYLENMAKLQVLKLIFAFHKLNYHGSQSDKRIIAILNFQKRLIRTLTSIFGCSRTFPT